MTTPIEAVIVMTEFHKEVIDRLHRSVIQRYEDKQLFNLTIQVKPTKSISAEQAGEMLKFVTRLKELMIEIKPKPRFCKLITIVLEDKNKSLMPIISSACKMLPISEMGFKLSLRCGEKVYDISKMAKDAKK